MVYFNNESEKLVKKLGRDLVCYTAVFRVVTQRSSPKTLWLCSRLSRIGIRT